MKIEQLDSLLARTLDDERLSRGERQALTEVLREDAPDAGALASYRSRVFDHARESLHDPRDRALLDWAEAVVKLLVPAADSDSGLREVWFSPGEDCLRAVKRLLASARRSVDICVFTITDNRIRDAVIQAHQRGVFVRLVTDDEKTLDRGSDVDDIEHAGVPVRIDKSPHHMHHKFAVVDRRILLTGSFNWTRSATVHNEENLLVCDEPSLVGPYLKRFEKLWSDYSS